MSDKDDLIYDEDDSVAFIQNYLPQELKGKFSNDDINYIVDLIYEFYESKGFLDENTDATPGTIVKVEKDGFSVQTGDGLLKVLVLQIPGKKRMEADAFLRGYQIETGCELSSQMIKNC